MPRARHENKSNGLTWRKFIIWSLAVLRMREQIVFHVSVEECASVRTKYLSSVVISMDISCLNDLAKEFYLWWFWDYYLKYTHEIQCTNEPKLASIRFVCKTPAVARCSRQSSHQENCTVTFTPLPSVGSYWRIMNLYLILNLEIEPAWTAN